MNREIPLLTQEIEIHWQPIATFFTIRSEAEYDEVIERLNSLLDEISTDEDHPLYGLLDTLDTVIRDSNSQFECGAGFANG